MIPTDRHRSPETGSWLAVELFADDAEAHEYHQPEDYPGGGVYHQRRRQKIGLSIGEIGSHDLGSFDFKSAFQNQNRRQDRL